MKRRILTFGLAAFLVFSNSLTARANWYETSTTYLQGINAAIQSVNPLEEISYGQFAEMLAKAGTYEHGEDALTVLKRRGFVQEGDTLSLESSITRKEALKLVLRGLGVKDEDVMAKAVEMGIITGYPDGETKEDKQLSYAEAAQILYNFRTKAEEGLGKEQAKQYSVEEFFQLPSSFGYQITKDGKYLIYGAPWENRINLFKKNMETGEVTQLTKITERNLSDYFVKGNTVLYMRDFGGNENFHIFKTDENGNEVDLTPFEDTRVIPLSLLEDVNIEDEILIQMNKDDKQLFSVYRLNIATGAIEKIVDNDAGYAGFLTDNEGKVRIAYLNDGVNSGYAYRDTEEEPFQVVKVFDFKQTLAPVLFSEDNKTVYATSNIDRNTTALIKIDPKTGEELEMIYQNEAVDISNIGRARKPGSLGALYYYTDKLNIKFFDEELEAFYKDCQKALQTDENISIASRSEDWNMATISTYSDTNRGITYLFDRKAGTLEKLADLNTVNSEDMAEMTPISFKSRDGLTIHGYLTIPKGAKPYNLPLVVNPHGGPWARDVWGYNPEVQFLANQGYAVLQINFRGSTGYGKDFLQAGYKQWGLNMQNDITDAVEWVKAIGLADANKIAIYGASYGGYATLAGITFTPDLYAAAVDYVGVSNLFTFLETIPAYWESMREQFYEMVGHPERDAEQFEATSPVKHADKIKTPLFIAQGANDPRVNKAESDQMVEALNEKGIEVEYMVKDNEGHGFSNFENQLEFYTKMKEFLAKHLGGR